MNRINVGEKIRVYIQREGGEIQEIAGAVKQINIYQNSMHHQTVGGEQWTIPTTIDTEIRIVGNSYELYNSDDFADYVENARTASEWRCDHCQSVNIRAHRHCDSCGFPRPFLYG